MALSRRLRKIHRKVIPAKTKKKLNARLPSIKMGSLSMMALSENTLERKTNNS